MMITCSLTSKNGKIVFIIPLQIIAHSNSNLFNYFFNHLTNRTIAYITRHDPTFHAEAGLIRRFCEETGITNLSEYTLYSNCEPCFMCCGAMVWARLGKLVYAASDIDLCEILGVRGSKCSEIVFTSSGASIEVISGVLRERALEGLRDYFSTHLKG